MWNKVITRLEEDSLAKLIRSCERRGDLSEARKVHSVVLRAGSHAQSCYIRNLLMQMYAKCGSPSDAFEVFLASPQRNHFSWTILVSSLCRNEEQACNAQQRMPMHDTITCSSMFAAVAGKGEIEDVKAFFERMPARGIHAWTSLLKAFTQRGLLLEAERTYTRMPAVDVVAANTMIAANAEQRNLHRAKLLFERFPERDVVSWNSFLNAHIRAGDLEGAKQVFFGKMQRNIVSWNEMLELLGEAAFDRMPQRDMVSWSRIVSSIAKSGHLLRAHNLALQAPEPHPSVLNPLVAAFFSCGKVQEAIEIFEGMPVTSLESWNTLLAGYAHNSLCDKARDVFDRMQSRNAVSWCAMLAAEEKPDRLMLLLERMPEHSLVACNAAIAGFARSGHLQYARGIFDALPVRDLASWTGMVASYAQHACGRNKEVMRLLLDLHLEGEPAPDGRLFVCVLVSCGRAGMLQACRQVFACMVRDHCIEPSREHYCSVADALGRAGSVHCAEQLIREMPLQPPRSVDWGVLMAASKSHNDIVRARAAALSVISIDPTYYAAHQLLASLLPAC